MRFQPFFEICFSILLLTNICLANEEAFISMAGDCRYPAVATEGNNIFMAWLVTEAKRPALYFQRSTDEGRTWNSTRKISNKNGDCQPPSIAVNSGMVHLAWVDCGEVIDGELYYTRSFDGGDTWEKNSVIVGNVNSATNPLITGTGSNVYLLWQDVGTRVFFKASRDKGLTWENEALLGKVGKHSCYCYPPALSVRGNEVVVVWNSLLDVKEGFDIRFFGFTLFKTDTTKMISSVICRKSADNGRTWSKERILTSTAVPKETTDEVDNPTLFTNGSRTCLFWQDKHDIPLGEILYTGFDPATEKGRITGKPLYPAPKRSSKCPSAVFDNDGNLLLVWTSFFRGESIVHYGAIDSSGNCFKEKKDLTTAAGRYQNPVITRTPSGLLHVFWFDKPDDKNVPARIFLTTSKDNGLIWQARGSQPEDLQN